MRHWTTLAAALAVLTLAAPARAGDPELHRFVYAAVREGLHDLQPASDVVERVLSADPRTGASFSFLPGCPVCEPVKEAFLAYREGRDVPARAGDPSAAVSVEGLSAESPRARTAALGKLVEALVAAGIRRSEWNEGERTLWQQRFRRAAEEGMARLEDQRKAGVATYQMMWSCKVCDGAERCLK